MKAVTVMINLRTELTKILKSIHPNIIVDGKSVSRVHYQNTTGSTPFPYIVYDLPTSFYSDNVEIMNLDIDIWDDNEDTTEIEALTGDVWKILDNFYHIDENIQFTIYRQSRSKTSRLSEEEETNIKRRTLIFNIRYHDRSVE